MFHLAQLFVAGCLRPAAPGACWPRVGGRVAAWSWFWWETAALQPSPGGAISHVAALSLVAFCASGASSRKEGKSGG